MPRTIVSVAGTLSLLCAAPLASQNAARCNGAGGGADSVAAALIAAVNDGSFAAIDRAYGTYWNVERMPPEARKSVETTLAQWHWTSTALSQTERCSLGPNVAYATVRNELTGETDSLAVMLSPAGKVMQLRVVQGVRSPVGTGDVTSDDARASMLDRLAQRMAAASVFSGEVLFAKNGRILLHKAYGASNRATGKPARIDDLYNIASVGKLLTGTAIMRLMEAGALSVDDTLGKFLPAGERPRDAGAVPLKYILAHTDGIIRDADTLAFKPGNRFSYVNYGYYLLGKTIESITKQPFATYFDSALFRPAGMTATRALHLDRVDSTLPPPYVFAFDSSGVRFDVNPLAQTTPATGAGGLFSTAHDLFRFAESLRTARLVSARTLQMMRKPKTELGATDYGYGVDWYRGNNIWGHTGYIPGANADLELYGDSGYVLVVLSNTGTNDPIRRRAFAMIGKQPVCFDAAGAACPV